MGTIIFLTFIGVCAFVVVWVTRSKERRQDLYRPPSEKLTPTSPDKLSRKEEIWEARRKFAEKELADVQRFVPRSEADKQPIYDGYSRRDRHHLTPQAKAKENLHAGESN
jgi:hypothetical protein